MATKKKAPCKDCKKKEKPELQVIHHMVKVCDLNKKQFRNNFKQLVLEFLTAGFRNYIHWVPMENVMVSGSHMTDEEFLKWVDKWNASKVSFMIGHPNPPPYCP